MDGNIVLRSWISIHTSIMTFQWLQELGKECRITSSHKILFYMYAESIIIMNTSGS